MAQIMSYENFKDNLNSRLFEGSRKGLLENIADKPDRFIGLFRPTKPKTKIIQNLTQSHEIKFGDALESLFTEYFALLGYINLPKKIIDTQSGDELNIDQLFYFDENVIYMIEQKVRDDHDSTKKRGQFANFENKYFEVTRKYKKTVVPIMWFVDDSLVKNKNYYLAEMKKMGADYKCGPCLCYGEELFTKGIIKNLSKDIWEETLSYLKIWKDTLPDMPEINFDREPRDTFEEIISLKPIVFRKLFGNEEIRTQILPILFPTGDVFKLLKEYFNTQTLPIYKTLADAMGAI
ncbi:MAG: restriction endonuclease [Clostridia bacterium]|nr:restriction endonuclease [Clostridia bacterium]